MLEQLHQELPTSKPLTVRSTCTHTRAVVSEGGIPTRWHTTQTDSEEQDARRHQCTHAYMHSQLSLFKSCTVNVSKLCTMLIVIYVWLLLLFCSFFHRVPVISQRSVQSSSPIQHLQTTSCFNTMQINNYDNKTRVYYDSNTKILNCT